MEKYIELLKSNQIKVTPQRLAIVSLMDMHGHISVREIFDKIKANFPSLSLATVYKNINAMLENNFIKELKIVGQDAKYELIKEAHSHMICQKCGKVEDIILDTQKLAMAAADKSAYQIEESTVQIFGVCPACQ
ncbi:MAG: transcriptional repressor [Epsilonproteobacteria bacterium]|nr:transcriptional repressor [Campylobacterota bacterium]